MPGYECKFVHPLLKRHECPICHHAMRNPMQTECGHLFCKDCLEPIFKERHPTCPLDKEKISFEQLFPDKACRREILNLDVYCTNAASGCGWIGKLKELDDHNGTCEYCSPVPCTPDGQVSSPSEIEHPISPGQHGVLHGEGIPAQQTQATALDYQISGISTRKTFLLNSSSHGDMVEPLSADYPTHVDEDRERRQRMHARRSSLEERVAQQSQKIDAQEEELRELRHEVEDLKRFIGSLCSNIQHSVPTPEHFESLNARVTEQTHSLDRCLSSSLDQELRLQLLERATYNGILLWKIDDFTRRRREAVDGVTLSLYSTPFYTSRHGYKMCARVYLNGDGLGKGTHLSFFFVTMRGPFDALLVWPFKQKVTLMLINQAGKKHVTDSFHPDPHSSSFQRPGRKEMNIASGCPMFIRVEHLLNGGFIRDDCIFLRIVVDTSDLPKVVP